MEGMKQREGKVDSNLVFRCSSRCNVCCVIRDYPKIYEVRDVKTGERVPIRPELLGMEGMVEIEPWELPKIQKLAKKMKGRVDEEGKPIRYRILPARGVSAKGAAAPEVVISYWLMGRYDDGDMCPFLSTPAENQRTSDGTLKCLIYDERPLQCRAYPVHMMYTDRIAGEKMAVLDQGCQWVMEEVMKGEARVEHPFRIDLIKNLDYGSLVRLQSGNKFDKDRTLWAHPTGTYGRNEKPDVVLEDWVDIGSG
jgi:Fe-S-cluster containining protein